jgi:hypothetical protein
MKNGFKMKKDLRNDVWKDLKEENFKIELTRSSKMLCLAIDLKSFRTLSANGNEILIKIENITIVNSKPLTKRLKDLKNWLAALLMFLVLSTLSLFIWSKSKTIAGEKTNLMKSVNLPVLNE